MMGTEAKVITLLMTVGLLPADVGAGTHAHFEIEAPAAALYVRAEVARRVGGADGCLERPPGVRIFPAQIDVAAVGARRQAGDGHALDEHERIALHDHAVGESARITFVCVADDVLLSARSAELRLPLDPRGERVAAPAWKARGG